MASKHPGSLGFSSLRAWPRVDGPSSFRQHVWGRLLDDGKMTVEQSSDRQPTLLLLGHSPIARADQISES